MYDLIVIGSGAGGSIAAFDAARKGWKVAVIDKQPPGGSCPQRACHPKKIMHLNMLPIFLSRLKNGKGLSSEPTADWQELVGFTKKFTGPVAVNTKKRFEKAGIEFISGEASFVAPDCIRVGQAEYRSGKFLIATGSRPRNAQIKGMEHVKISDDFFTMNELPDKIIFLGGGYVSFELASIAALSGSDITIINNSSQVLKQFDQDLVKIMLKSLKYLHITLVAPAKVKSILKNNTYIVETENGSYQAGVVFHGMGRVPDIDALSLDKAGVKYSSRGIAVNEHLRTSNENIYAAGDCTEPGPMLTPVGGKQGEIASGNIISGKKNSYDPGQPVASTVFTMPAIASIGTAKGEVVSSLEPLYTDRMRGLDYGGWKLYLEKGRIAGAHVVSLGADDIINSISPFLGKRPDSYLEKILAYPSYTYEIREMMKASGSN